MMATQAYESVTIQEVDQWVEIGPVGQFTDNDGTCILYEGLQIAVFRFTRRNEWFATQNLCPHKKQMILSRGLIGSAGEEPKVSCPYHKNSFSLRSGKHLNGDLCDLATYPVKCEDGRVFLGWKSR